MLNVDVYAIIPNVSKCRGKSLHSHSNMAYHYTLRSTYAIRTLWEHSTGVLGYTGVDGVEGVCVQGSELHISERKRCAETFTIHKP